MDPTAHRRPDGRFLALLGLALLVGLALRIGWPLADPASGLSWSSGTYTDPPGNTLPARYAAQFGDPDLVPIPERHVYPLLNGLTRAAFEIFGPSRLSTQILSALLGISAFLVLATAIRRGAGASAGTLCLLLGATDWWHGMYSRVLVAEHVVALALAGASWFALGRGRWDAVFAGGLAAVAAFYGKYHAIAYLPALLAFLVLRGGMSRASGAGAGFLAVGVLWLLTIFFPHRADILEWVGESSVGVKDASPLLAFPGLIVEPFATLREAWLFHRLPVLAAVAAIGLTVTLSAREELRRRVDDGSALLVFWIAAFFLYYAALPYRAPRYFIPLALPLIALGSTVLAGWLEGRFSSETGRLRSVALFVGMVIAAFGLLDLLKHLEAIGRETLFPIEWIRAGGGPADLALVFDVVGPLPRHVLTSFVVAAPLFLVARRLRSTSPGLRMNLSRLAVGLALFGNLVQWGWWMAHRTYVIEEAKESLRGVVGEDAVLFGGYAPLLTLDSELRAIPRFGRWERIESLTGNGATHVLVSGAAERNEIASRFSEAASMVRVREWPIRTGWGRSVELFRLAAEPEGYERSAFEKAVDRAHAGDWEGALAILKGQSGEPLPDSLVLEARCRFALGDPTRAEALLVEAADRRPRDPSIWYHLGTVAAQRGDPEAGRQYWSMGLRIHPEDPDLREAFLLSPDS